MTEPMDWSGGLPRSPRFDDIYFSSEDGLAEARAVFLEGCGLPEAWRGRRRFAVGELGFGTGLNVLALADLWRRERPGADAILHIVSIEAFPISRSDAARALAPWPEIADLAQILLQQWPGGRRGWHRIEWPKIGVILDLAIVEVEAALHDWSGSADAWFLDGFAPAKNPQMWRPEVLSLVAARSRAGARVATFSVAGAVRRGLGEVGFEVQKVPGFGAKKQRLIGRLTAANPPICDPGPPSVAIIGAGVAGASLARAFRRLGAAPTVIEANEVGAGASGNRAALVTPRLDAGLGDDAALYAAAFARAIALYRLETPDAVIADGALQLQTQPQDSARFGKIAAWDGFDPGTVRTMRAANVADALDEPLGVAALEMTRSLVIDPMLVLQAWLGGKVRRVAVASLQQIAHGWRLLDVDGETIAEAEIVCLAGGPDITRLSADLPLRPVRGQVTMSEGAAFAGVAASWGGYAIPTRSGVLFGATHRRDDPSSDPRDEEDLRNWADLRRGRPTLAARLQGAPTYARASLRAMSPDHRPLAGAVPGAPGLYVLSGLGGRGFSLAPLLAEAVAAQALNAPSPLPHNLEKRVDPERFGRS
jgi:tRNA 5-methylaminomethyl-2-thiouridine biosynthesis bifunctional protein